MRKRGCAGIVPSILVGPDKHKCNSSKTPTEASVNWCLQWLSGYVDRNEMRTVSYLWTDYKNEENNIKFGQYTSFATEMIKLRINVVSTYGLMMGCCHLICEVDSSIYSPELVQEAIEITDSVFRKYIRYHKKTA